MSVNFIKLNKSFLDLNKFNNFTYIEVLLSLNIKVLITIFTNRSVLSKKYLILTLTKLY